MDEEEKNQREEEDKTANLEIEMQRRLGGEYVGAVNVYEAMVDAVGGFTWVQKRPPRIIEGR